MDQFISSEHIASLCAPVQPVIIQRPHAATRAAKWFTDHFPGKAFYAVKANADPMVLEAIGKGGINHFDVASIAEVRLIRGMFPEATLAFMHPIKPAEAIREAYFDHGVRIFSLDCDAELHKILKATEGARDLTLCVRLAVTNDAAKMSLVDKFGAKGDAAISLLRQTRLVAQRLGVCFHPGSQTMNPAAYASAMDQADEIIRACGVVVEVVDVGGGFPVAYPGMEPPSMHAFVDQIAARFETFLSTENSELWCEPGRALCAEAQSLLVRIDGRRDQDLYLNDGVYGALSDAGHFAWRYPVRSFGTPKSRQVLPYRFYGPTCDSADMMPGPFYLPADMDVGDYIEVGMIGAYGRALASNFNGFGVYDEVICEDDPFGSVFLPLPFIHQAQNDR
ncbi:type III PLP-dependent enzyme [Parvularcula sp. LCG005]|uniref:type III PLP-dependent enzyme n=1 Tax=Parvularcula sp. LCG005 TaxID=3078805 RepID=UPI002942C5FE|nr:type III PLP-dependent enzyme [Parvularcula sp. LCG005]WOI54010.1 type III PLP-dependent enzyme [Parvularcula sp. LCG005]